MDDTLISSIIEGSGSGNIVFDGKKDSFIVSKAHSDIMNWTLAYILPYTRSVQLAWLSSKIIFTSIIVVILVSFLISYIFTYFLHKPISSIVAKVKAVGTPLHEHKNDFKVIDEAIKSLYDESCALKTKYQMAFPYF